MRRRQIAAVLAALALLNLGAMENWKLPPETAKLKPGPGAGVAMANCMLCHSVDYISTQPPLTRTAWKAAVEKMRLKYGAPIATNKVDEIADYLAATYGRK